ncbi:MAG: nucleotidyltransferase domain-containing protein [Azoarcus sp.]|jgi:predicted nucleotidyltransferase|nr:nucleotidyltransferase domain-containing protein [Azoarcus sp.]
MSIRTEIETRLRAIEMEHGVRILYACESGSRGWGFASPDSDYDVRFLYVHPLSWYLRVLPGRDVIELPISDVLDINGWELRKALRLLGKGNATLIEWLDSPVQYRADPVFLESMRRVAQQTWRPERAFHHYIHMARGNDRGYLRGETVRYKKYLYVLRPLLAAQWVAEGRGIPPMRFQALVDGIVDAPDLRQAIGALLDKKLDAAETEYGPSIPVINDFIDAQLARLAGSTPPVRDRIDLSPLDDLLMKAVLPSGGNA